MGLCRWGSRDVASPGRGLKLALTLLRITVVIFFPRGMVTREEGLPLVLTPRSQPSQPLEL